MADANVPAWQCPRGHIQITSGQENNPGSCNVCNDTNMKHLGNIRITNIRQQ